MPGIMRTFTIGPRGYWQTTSGDKANMSANHSAALLLLAGVALGGCAVTGEPQPPPGPAHGPAHDGLDAVLWLQTATEYAASARGVYAAAT